jgi:hypothetical protein
LRTTIEEGIKIDRAWLDKPKPEVATSDFGRGSVEKDALLNDDGTGIRLALNEGAGGQVLHPGAGVAVDGAREHPGGVDVLGAVEGQAAQSADAEVVGPVIDEAGVVPGDEGVAR